MGEPRPTDEQVVDMAEYLRDTLAEIDSAIAELTERRMGIATRLAVILAATDPGTQAAIDDYSARIEEGRPYEDAQDANDLIMEAHRRFVQ
jgi:hypothetical protein